MQLAEFHDDRYFAVADICNRGSGVLRVNLDQAELDKRALTSHQLKSSRQKVSELINEWSNLTGLRGISLLSAHGMAEEEWLYIEGNNANSVSEWIAENDGKSAALLLAVCNPSRHQIKTEKSIAVHVMGNYCTVPWFLYPFKNREWSHRFNGNDIRVFHPQFGYLK